MAWLLLLALVVAGAAEAKSHNEKAKSNDKGKKAAPDETPPPQPEPATPASEPVAPAPDPVARDDNVPAPAQPSTAGDAAPQAAPPAEPAFVAPVPSVAAFSGGSQDPHLVPIPLGAGPESTLTQAAAVAPGRTLGWGAFAFLLGTVGTGAFAVTRFRRKASAVTPETRVAPVVLSADLDVHALLRMGQDAVRAKQYEVALDLFRKAREQVPGLSVALVCEGACLAGLARFEESFETFLAAHRMDPMDGGTRVQLARAAAATGRSLEAIAALGPVLAAHPEGVADVERDPAFAGLRDHPAFLQMLGRL